jgi:hypothetical protein
VKLSALKRTKVPVFRGKDSKNGSGEGEVLNILGFGVQRVSRLRVSWLGFRVSSARGLGYRDMLV